MVTSLATAVWVKMSLTFEEAVTNLQVMFPALDTGVIAAVLESNGGHMEHTVTQLLELDAGAAAGAPQPAKGKADGSGPGPAAPSKPPARTAPSSARAPVMHAPAASAAAASSSDASGARRWRNPLPDDFLRVPAVGAAHTSSSSNQVMQDQLLAQMLENELFLEELRNNPEFAGYLFEEADPDSRVRHRAHGAGAGRQAATGPTWQERLASMGGGMKRKFNSLALRFKRNTGGGARSSSTGGGDPSQYRSLLGDGDDDDAGDAVIESAAHRRGRATSTDDGMALAVATRTPSGAEGRAASGEAKKLE